MSMTKDDRRNRFARRKAKHVRDIRHKDFICNQREAVEYGVGESHNDGAAYNVQRAANIAPISRGGGWVAGNPRYSDTRRTNPLRQAEAADAR